MNSNNPQISIIVAVTTDNAIGRDGNLVVHIRDDMRHFREVTMGHPVIMGRKTWESLPGGALPGRRNMVVSRNADYRAEGAETYTSLQAAIDALRPGDEAMIIGGAEIYRQAMPLANRLYLTLIDTTVPDADTFFPPIDDSEWSEINPDTNQPSNATSQWRIDERTGLHYRFICMTRK